MQKRKRIAYSREAVRSLRRLPINMAERIRAKLRQYAEAPESLAGNVKALKGERGRLRLRVGRLRVIFIEDSESINIIRIAPRGRVYD
jgi:mRNA interferase RelE/StbE